MPFLLLILAACTGLSSAVQPGANAALAKGVSPFLAGLASLAGSAVILAAAGLVTGQLAWPSSDEIVAIPWWAWTGGVLGASVLAGQLFLAGPLGSAVFMALNVSAAVILSVILDHYGLVGFKQHAASWGRIGGAVLMVGGVALIAAY